MTVVQVLVVNLLTDGLPAVALARDPASPDTMRRPPQGLGTLLGRELGHPGDRRRRGRARRIRGLPRGPRVGARRGPDDGLRHRRPRGAGAGLRGASPRSPAWRAGRNPALILAVAGSVLVVAASIYLPLGRELLETAWLGPAELGIVLLLALLPTVVLEAAKAVRR